MRVIRLKAVMDYTGLARSTIYKYIKEGLFPKPISLGSRSVGWIQREVEEWIRVRIKARDAASS
jgi:prophage regulatory protein